MRNSFFFCQNDPIIENPKRRVAVVGTSGMLGRYLVDELKKIDEYAYPIHVLTRNSKLHTNNDKVQYYEASFDNSSNLDIALQGVDTVIDLTGDQVDATPLIDASVRVGVSVYFLSEYTIDYPKEFASNSNPFRQKQSNMEYASKQNFNRVVQIVPGVMMEWLVDNIDCIGIDTTNQVYTVIEDGNFGVSMTSCRDVARSVASLAYRPSRRLPQLIRIHGQVLTLNQMARCYERCTRTKLSLARSSPRGTGTRDHKSYPDLVGNLVVRRDQPLNMNGRVQNEVVNPGIWPWQTFEQVASQKWSVAR